MSRTLTPLTLYTMLVLHSIPTLYTLLSLLCPKYSTSLQAQEPRALLPDAMRAECARVMVTEADGNLVQGSKLQAHSKHSRSQRWYSKCSNCSKCSKCMAPSCRLTVN